MSRSNDRPPEALTVEQTAILALLDRVDAQDMRLAALGAKVAILQAEIAILRGNDRAQARNKRAA